MTTKINRVPGTRKPPPPDDRHHLELPFAWETGPDAPDPDDRGVLFRFPAPDDPKPGTRRLLGLSLCASLLGLTSLVVTVRTLLSIVSGPTPAWFGPVVALTALAGVLPTIAAFLAVHRRRLPWLLLLAAVPPLAAAAALTAVVP